MKLEYLNELNSSVTEWIDSEIESVRFDLDHCHLTKTDREELTDRLCFLHGMKRLWNAMDAREREEEGN